MTYSIISILICSLIISGCAKKEEKRPRRVVESPDNSPNMRLMKDRMITQMSQVLKDKNIPEKEQRQVLEFANQFFGSSETIHRDDEMDMAVKNYIAKAKNVSNKDVNISHPYEYNKIVNGATVSGYFMKNKQKEYFTVAVLKNGNSYTIQDFATIIPEGRADSVSP